MNPTNPEDQEHEEIKKFVDSSLSVNEVVAWIVDETPGMVADLLGDGGHLWF